MKNRATKYRRLALASIDPEVIRLLCQLADEADRGVLATCDWDDGLTKAPSETKSVNAAVEHRIYMPFNQT